MCVCERERERDTERDREERGSFITKGVSWVPFRPNFAKKGNDTVAHFNINVKKHSLACIRIDLKIVFRYFYDVHV